MKTIKFGKNALIYSPLCFLIFIYPAPYFLLFAIGIRQNHISIKPFPAFLFSLILKTIVKKTRFPCRRK